MNRLSARSWRLIAALGFWVLIIAALTIGGGTGLALAYAGGAWLAAFSLQAWRRQDEFEKSAQKFSWMFGGLFGLLISIALLPAATQPGVLAPLLGWVAGVLSAQDPVGPAFILGAVYIAMGQLIGFLVCWVGWHISKR
jgi:hypothetical protein